MTVKSSSPAAPLRFTQAELDMLAKTADALTAYLGRPVLAEVDTDEDGAEWVTFGSTLDEKDKSAADEDRLHVHLGGKEARLLGQSGGLPESADAYDCLYLLAIQLSANEGERFVKIDRDGEESAWSDVLAEVLPFSLEEEELPPLEDDEDEDEDDQA
ncbi:hypothetical protein [Bordetella sp. FB-8]|uniref:hypothetical protein n=1 Tax=Bordetella sp. FB-8 TaxID=1159870 RepID=UPI00037CACD1|nr:hypothetical protein [Bordetella sp. FB-8]